MAIHGIVTGIQGTPNTIYTDSSTSAALPESVTIIDPNPICIFMLFLGDRRTSFCFILCFPTSPRLGLVLVVCLASSEGVCRCVSGGSRMIHFVVVFGGSARILSLFVFILVSSGWILPSKLLFIGDGYCSTTTSCVRLRRGRGDDDGAPSARFSACSRR